MPAKVKKPKIDMLSMLDDIKNQIKKENLENSKPMNIIEFGNMLLKDDGMALYPQQEIILKLFYAGTRFNEDLRITKKDIGWIESLDDEIPQIWITHGENNKLGLIEEHLRDKDRYFTELILVLGRRSGKSFLCALISSYEAYKLICLKDPQRFYGITQDIWIVNTAKTGEQAKTIIFKEITKFIHKCPVFSGRIGKELDDILYIRTDADIEFNKKVKDFGGRERDGSIVIASGNSNSEALRGHASICLFGDSLLLSKNGMKKIKNIELDDFIYDGEKYVQIVAKTVQKDNIYELLLENNKFIKCNEEHPFLVWDNEKGKIIKKFSELKEDDKLLILKNSRIFSEKNYVFDEEYIKRLPHYHKVEFKEKCQICGREVGQINFNHTRFHSITMKEYVEEFGEINRGFHENRIIDNYLTFPKEMSNDLAFIIGCLLSEGNYSKGNIFQFGGTDKDYVEEYAAAIFRIFNKKKNILLRKKVNEKEKQYYMYNFSSDKIKIFLSEVVGLGNRIHDTKEIPECIMLSTKEAISFFLKGLFDGDGCMGKKSVSYSSTSKNLINGLSILMDNFGFNYYNCFQKGKENQKDHYTLGLYADSGFKFVNEIGFFSKRKLDLSDNFRETRKQKEVQTRNVNPDIDFWMRIRNEIKNNNFPRQYSKIRYSLLSSLRDIFNPKKRQISISREKLEKLYKINEELKFLSKNSEEALNILMNYELIKVKSKNIIGFDDVYNIEVNSDEHLFIANGILTHNCNVMDEMAYYMEGEKSSADDVYSALTPSAATFSFKGDGRNIIISSPNMPSGFFYKLYNDAKTIKEKLIFQIPSWRANPTFTKTNPMYLSALASDPQRAMAEYGAKFRVSAGSNYFPHEKVDKAFTLRENWYMQQRGQPGIQYYLHIDVGQNSDRYAFMVAHPEWQKVNIEGFQQNVMFIVEDCSMFFAPPRGGYLDPDTIMDNFILPLFQKYKIISVTYDAMFGLEQQKKLLRRGIFTRKISFGGSAKNTIYQDLYDLLIQERVILCADDEELKGELKNVIISYNRVPPKINKNDESEYPYDDIVDSLCGVLNSVQTGSLGQTRLPLSGISVNADPWQKYPVNTFRNQPYSRVGWH